jgi:Beta/Gamma crystallin
MAGKATLAGFAVLLGLAAPALAQRGEATIYRDRSFSGPAVFVDRTQPNLGLNWQVQSIRVASGAWELCPQPNFRGNCLIVGQSTANLRQAYGWAGPLQSMRPVNPGGGGGNSPDSLRGMAAEFFPAPRQGGSRVLGCRNGSASAACAAESAERFCRSVGWRGALHQSLQSERNRVYLADVLCANAGV